MKKVVIGITGSIAIYKTCEIISRLKKKNYDIEVIMTESATKFITPLTFGALIHKPVLVDDFDETGYQIKHINIVLLLYLLLQTLSLKLLTVSQMML